MKRMGGLELISGSQVKDEGAYRMPELRIAKSKLSNKRLEWDYSGKTRDTRIKLTDLSFNGYV